MPNETMCDACQSGPERMRKALIDIEQLTSMKNYPEVIGEDIRIRTILGIARSALQPTEVRP